MSVEQTIICDGCGAIVAAERTPREGRRVLRRIGGLTAVPERLDSKDFCPSCVRLGRHLSDPAPPTENT